MAKKCSYIAASSSSFAVISHERLLRRLHERMWQCATLTPAVLCSPQLEKRCLPLGPFLLRSQIAIITGACSGSKFGPVVAQGLAMPALSKQGQLPAFFRMLESGLLDEPLFSIWLSPDPTLEPAGKIHFGGHNPARYTGELLDLPVISKKCASTALSCCRPHALYSDQEPSLLMLVGLT